MTRHRCLQFFVFDPAKIQQAEALEDETAQINIQSQPNPSLPGLKTQDLLRVKEQLENVRQEKITRDARLANVEETTKTFQEQDNAVSSSGWMEDLLKDSNDWSFHRLQMPAWTVIWA